MLVAVALAWLLVLAALLRRLRALAPLAALLACALLLLPLAPPLLSLLRACVRPRGTPAALGTLALPLLGHLLLELLNLARHVLTRRRVHPGAELVVAAVRTAPPTLGIGAFAGGAEDALRERHVEPVAHCTLPPVARNDPEERRKTLKTLIELAEGSSPVDCWDDQRAEDLLRSQTTPDEARSLGMSEGLVERVFGAAASGDASSSDSVFSG